MRLLPLLDHWTNIAYTRCNSVDSQQLGENTKFDQKHAVLVLKVLAGKFMEFMVGQFV